MAVITVSNYLMSSQLSLSFFRLAQRKSSCRECSYRLSVIKKYQIINSITLSGGKVST